MINVYNTVYPYIPIRYYTNRLAVYLCAIFDPRFRYQRGDNMKSSHLVDQSYTPQCWTSSIESPFGHAYSAIQCLVNYCVHPS